METGRNTERKQNHGLLDPTQDWNQPLGQPLYPPLPWHSRDGEHVAVEYETDPESVLELLPYDLEPADDPPRVTAWLGHFDFCTGGGPYSECSALIRVRYDGRIYHYPPAVYLGNDGCEEWFAAGREVWGHHKKMANIYVEKHEGKGLVHGWCERPIGEKLVDIVVGPFEGVGDPDDLQFIPVISVRTIPHPEKPEPETVQLIETEFDAQIIRSTDGVPNLWVGQGSVRITRSEQDPWYKLPVRRVVRGFYANFNFVTGYGRILKQYV